MNSLLEWIRLQVCKGPKPRGWLLTSLSQTIFLSRELVLPGGSEYGSLVLWMSSRQIY